MLAAYFHGGPLDGRSDYVPPDGNPAIVKVPELPKVPAYGSGDEAPATVIHVYQRRGGGYDYTGTEAPR